MTFVSSGSLGHRRIDTLSSAEVRIKHVLVDKITFLFINRLCVDGWQPIKFFSDGQLAF